MRHILTFLHKRAVLNTVAVLLSAVLVGLVFQLFSTYSVHALRVRTEIKATPPGIAKIIDKKGHPPRGLINPQSNRPSVLTINTDIDFGTVFPEETVQGHFIVYLTGTGNATDNETWTHGPYDAITYNVTMTTNVTPYKDLRPYLVVQRDPAELDIEPDNTANGTSNDYSAQGSLNATDTGDKWFVTLKVPDDLGDYWIKILVEVP